ncbi:MAG: hypothetical protein ACRDBP_19000, partial [Luteolibacter sp.]
MKTLALIFLVAFSFLLQAMAEDPAALRKERDKLTERGMWRDAVSFYEEKLMPLSDAESGTDLVKANDALRRLDAWAELDGLVERAVSSHSENAKVLRAAALIYAGAPQGGRLVAGEFLRDGQGQFSGRASGPNADPAAAAGSWVDTRYRDRVRAWQLFRKALGTAKDDPEKYEIWEIFAAYFPVDEAWKLQTLTPLDPLPEWGEPGPEGGTEGAPWAKDGPVLYDVPASWETAKNDGERWRFALAEMARSKPSQAFLSTQRLAEFSSRQFGTETLSSFGWWHQQDPDSAKGLLEMDTLAEDECLAKTSDGVRRFKLPAEQHFIALYRSIMEQNEHAGDALVRIFLNRRQYDKAREVLEQVLVKFGPTRDGSREKLLKQITGNWGRFEPAATVPAGVKPKLPLVFRNATHIKLTAAPVDMEAVLKDSIDFLKSNPSQLDDRVNASQIASRLIAGKAEKYIGKVSATWDMKLTPREKHRETRTHIEVPLDKAGAWWISGQMADGNSFHTLVWIIDSVLVENDVGGNKQWWLADAASGAPVVGADIEFFGYRTIPLE